MAVQVACPHCQAPCRIDDQQRGSAVRCHACARPFMTPPLVVKTPVKLAPPPPSAANDDFPLPTFDAVPETAPAALHLDIGGATTVGKVRPNNEDGYLVCRQTWSRESRTEELAILAVADGMGGHGGGERACALALQALQRSLTPLFDEAQRGALPADAGAYLGERLRAALGDASKAVHRAAQTEPQCKGMGAAAIVAALWRGTAHISHVGDCRAYHFHAGALTQLTKDHTLVQRMLDLGTLKEHEAKNHPAKNELTQAIGRRPDVDPGLSRATLGKDDWLVLASDGLYVHLTHVELRRELELSLPTASFLAQHLTEVADERGGSDNCTVVAVYCS